MSTLAFVTPTTVTSGMLESFVRGFVGGYWISHPTHVSAGIQQGDQAVWFETNPTDDMTLQECYSAEEWQLLKEILHSEPRSMIGFEVTRLDESGQLLQAIVTEMHQIWGGGLENELLPNTSRL